MDLPAKEPPENYRPAAFRWSVPVVGAVWLAALATAILLTQWNTNSFMADDFTIVPYMVGLKPVSWGYLWSQLNEHRIPLPG